MTFAKRKFRFILSIFLVTAFTSGSFAEAAKATPKKKAPSTKAVKAVPSPTPLATPVELPSPTPMPTIEPLPSPEPTPEATPVAEALEANREAASSASSFKVGPYVTAVALPRPLSAGLESKLNDYIGLSAAYGFIPQITISSNKIKLTGWDARVKFYPLGGSFFLGFGYGSQTFTGSRTETIQGVSVTGTVDQSNNFILPHVGWNWIADSGFFMGIDLGVQLSLSRKTNFTSDTTNAAILASSQYTDLQTQVLDKADQLGKTPLPLLTLLKVGFMF